MTFAEVGRHGDYVILRRQPGFEFSPGLLGKIGSYLARRDGEEAPGVFAFMYHFAELTPDAPPPPEEEIERLALEEVQRALNGDAVGGRERTYELRGGDWVEVFRPAWWVSAFR